MSGLRLSLVVTLRTGIWLLGLSTTTGRPTTKFVGTACNAVLRRNAGAAEEHGEQEARHRTETGPSEGSRNSPQLWAGPVGQALNVGTPGALWIVSHTAMQITKISMRT